MKKSLMIKRIIYALLIDDNVRWITTKDILMLCPSPETHKITKPYINQVLSQLVESKYLTRIRRGIYTRGLGGDSDLHKWEKSIMPKVPNQDKNDESMKFSRLGVDDTRDYLIKRNYNNSIYATCSIERLNDLYKDRSEIDFIQMGYRLHDGSIVKGLEALRWFAFTQIL